MRTSLVAALLLSHGSAFVACDVMHSEKLNADGSRIRITQRQCDATKSRTLHVEFQPQGSESCLSLLKRTQSVSQAPTGGWRLRDIDADGLFEIEETGACGAGPNCEHRIFKTSVGPGPINAYLFFQGGYAGFKRISDYYVASGRSSCCSWDHQVYKKPMTADPITDSDLVYEVMVGVDVGDPPRTRCRVFSRVDRNLIQVPLSDKKLLTLCEVYGENYVLNPPFLNEVP